ncbi:hypothetical protein CEP51_006949 [Fusarium floridanum]|uniref:non-specific serine/threonine protein kinase n=1 Tax=Fusarium floridanum TaxID=1325733 RepID=A0A428RR51_9HYPO|nr:hypothetical protein CEP51_006949 [Fusarium floridanum]
MAVNPTTLPDLVQDSKLDATTFQGELTIHTHPLGRQIRIEKWKRHEILGQGGYGVVWLEHKVGGDARAEAVRRAVKVVRNHGGRGPMRYSRELEALAKFSHEKYSDFFVKFLGWYENPESDHLHIAMEYCPHGDLKKYLASIGGRLPESQVKSITSQVLAGVVMMHRAGFANRDIKPAVSTSNTLVAEPGLTSSLQNILIKSKPPDNWWVKICDFGVSKRAEDDSPSIATTVVGTPGFMPPEILGFSPGPCRANGFMVDMWCLGETVFQALTGKAVFDIPAAVGQYFNGNLDFPAQLLHHANASAQAKSFIISLMKAQPLQRMNSEAAIRHPWMLDIALGESIDVPQSQGMTTQSIGTAYQPILPQVRAPGDQLTQESGEWTTTLTLANKALPKDSPSNWLSALLLLAAHVQCPALLGLHMEYFIRPPIWAPQMSFLIYPGNNVSVRPGLIFYPVVAPPVPLVIGVEETKVKEED